MGKSHSKQLNTNNLYSISKSKDKEYTSDPLIQQFSHLPFKNQSIFNISKLCTLSDEQKISSLKGNLSNKRAAKLKLLQEFNLDYAFADDSIAGIRLIKSCNAVIVLHGEFIKLWYLDEILPSKTLCIGRRITGMNSTYNKKNIIYSTEHEISIWNYETNEQRTFQLEFYSSNCHIISSKDEKYIACILYNKILLLDSDSMEKIFYTTLEHLQVDCIILTNDNKYIIAAIQRYTRNANSVLSDILVYSLLDENDIKEIDCIKYAGLTIKVSDDNEYLVTDSSDKTIRVWKLQLILNNIDNFKQFQNTDSRHSAMQNDKQKSNYQNSKNAKDIENSKYKISEIQINVSLRNQYRFEITKDNKYLLIYNEKINEFQLFDIVSMSLLKRIAHEGNLSYSYFILSHDFEHFFVPEHPFVLKKISIINSEVTTYKFFGSGVCIQSFCLSKNKYLFTCYATNYKDIKICPFTIYNLETDQHVSLCVENEYALIAADMFNQSNTAVVSCCYNLISLWDLTSSKVIKNIRGIQATQLEISEDDSKIILFDDQLLIIILNAFSLEKLRSFNSSSVIIMKVYTEISTIVLKNQVLNIFNLSKGNSHEKKKITELTKSKKYCIVSNLSGNKIYVINVHGGDGIFKAL